MAKAKKAIRTEPNWISIEVVFTGKLGAAMSKVIVQAVSVPRIGESIQIGSSKADSYVVVNVKHVLSESKPIKTVIQVR